MLRGCNGKLKSKGYKRMMYYCMENIKSQNYKDIQILEENSSHMEKANLCVKKDGRGTCLWQTMNTLG